MSEKPPLKIAGVPEAYNDPFATADFVSHGIQPPIFCSHPGGSGAMLQAVISKEVDAAFALTDCIVAAIENRSPVRLAGPLIHTPLTWAVVVAREPYKHVSQLSHACWGVSRLGSGSHVMAQLLAKQHNWPSPKTHVCRNFNGLRLAVNDAMIDAFLWEHYTTKPYADSDQMRIIGGVPTPWGCFSVVVRDDCDRVDDIRHAVDAFLAEGKRFLDNEDSVQAISQKHRMTPDDAQKWIDGVRYATPGERKVDEAVLELTRSTLRDAGVIKNYLCEGGVKAYHI